MIPNSLQFKNNLKLISILMYIKHISNSNYDYDDKKYLSDFLEYVSEKTP